MGFLESLQRQRQSSERGFLAYAQPYWSRGGFFAQALQHIFIEIDRAMRVLDQQFAVARQSHAPAAAVEKFASDNRFQPRHLLAHSRLCLSNSGRSTSHTSMADYSKKSAQKAEFQIVLTRRHCHIGYLA